MLAVRCRSVHGDRNRPLIESLTARSFRRSLRKLDRPTPLRSEGRTTQHCERASIVRLLTVIQEDIVLPVRLVHRERPDFALTVGDREVGVEHTEAIHPNEAHSMALREQGHGPDVFFVNRSRPGDTKKSTAEILQEIADDEAGDGWAGHSAEEEWADAMLGSIHRKVNAANKPGFNRFRENWLLVYDNWSLPHIDVMVASQKLQEGLDTSVFNTYGTIHIVNDHWCWTHAMDGFTVERVNRPTGPPLPRWPRQRKR